MKCLAVLLAALFLSIGVAGAQQIKEMEFKNQAIVDILLALAEMSGKSIVPDETVTGTASYYFNETDFETALKIFSRPTRCTPGGMETSITSRE